MLYWNLHASNHCTISAFSALTLLVGWQEGHLACKKWDGGDGHCLVRMEWRPAGWSVCLPLLIFPYTIKSRGSLLALSHPDGPGKRAVKWLYDNQIWKVTACAHGVHALLLTSSHSMLQGSENWPVRKENEVALNRAEMRMVRWMCNVKVKVRVPSKELRLSLIHI